MMITSSANICRLIQIKYKEKKKEKSILLVRGTLRIYTLNNFPAYHTTVSTTVIVLYVTSPGCLHLITGSLFVLTIFLQFLLFLPIPYLW